MSTHFRVAFSRRMTRAVSVACIALLLALPFVALAQTAPASASSTIITVPPRPLTSVPPGQDGASDSTLYSTGIPAPVPSSIQIALPSGGGTTPPPTTCTAGSSAPASNCTALTCPSGYSGTPSYSCACNSTGNGYVSTPTQTQVNSAPTSYGCTALACTAGASEPTADCTALTCPSGYNGTPSYTCACNSAGTGYVSTPTQTQVNSTPTSYGCTAQACTPSATQSCTISCSGGGTATGSQTCNSTGTAWGACSATCPVTCTPGSSTQTQTATCPTGQTVGGTSGGATSFSQSQTVTESCPAGSTGAPSYTYSGWSPTVASTCSAVITCTPGSSTQTQTASCTYPQTVGGASGGATSFSQSRTVTESCPSGSTGAPSYTYSAWSPTASSECATVTCTYSCGVGCFVTKTSGEAYWNFIGHWTGGTNCPASGTLDGQSAYNVPTAPSFCSGTLPYSYASTTGTCP